MRMKELITELQSFPEVRIEFNSQNAHRRANAAYKKNLEEPGDCSGDNILLMCLAVAQAIVGVRPGWIPEVQRRACEYAEYLEGVKHEST